MNDNSGEALSGPSGRKEAEGPIPLAYFAPHREARGSPPFYIHSLSFLVLAILLFILGVIFGPVLERASPIAELVFSGLAILVFCSLIAGFVAGLDGFTNRRYSDAWNTTSLIGLILNGVLVLPVVVYVLGRIHV